MGYVDSKIAIFVIAENKKHMDYLELEDFPNDVLTVIKDLSI